MLYYEPFVSSVADGLIRENSWLDFLGGEWLGALGVSAVFNH